MASRVLPTPPGPTRLTSARLGEFLPDLGQLATAADEAGRLGRKVAWAACGPRHKGRLYGAAARIRYPLGNSADAGPAGAFLA